MNSEMETGDIKNDAIFNGQISHSNEIHAEQKIRRLSANLISNDITKAEPDQSASSTDDDITFPYIFNGSIFKVQSRNDHNIVVRCNYCNNFYKGSLRSTGNFHMHIRRRHPDLMGLLNKMRVESITKKAIHSRCKRNMKSVAGGSFIPSSTKGENSEHQMDSTPSLLPYSSVPNVVAAAEMSDHFSTALVNTTETFAVKPSSSSEEIAPMTPASVQALLAVETNEDVVLDLSYKSVNHQGSLDQSVVLADKSLNDSEASSAGNHLNLAFLGKYLADINQGIRAMTKAFQEGNQIAARRLALEEINLKIQNPDFHFS